jgi:hypothetical protein
MSGPRIPRAQVIALSHPAPVRGKWDGWIVAAVAVGILLAGLLGS